MTTTTTPPTAAAERAAYERRGAAAFAAGTLRAPILDLGAAFTSDRARAWLRGWDAANIAEPVAFDDGTTYEPAATLHHVDPTTGEGRDVASIAPLVNGFYVVNGTRSGTFWHGPFPTREAAETDRAWALETDTPDAQVVEILQP